MIHNNITRIYYPKDPNRPRDVAVFRGVGVLTSRTLKSWGRACETPGACPIVSDGVGYISRGSQNTS